MPGTSSGSQHRICSSATMNTLVVLAVAALVGAAVARPQGSVFDPFPKYNPLDVGFPQPSAAPTHPPPPPPHRPVEPDQSLPLPAPQPAIVPVRTTRQASNDYETEDGIAAIAPNEDGPAAQGFYSYTAPDGTPIRVTYTADENGFQAQGDHSPVAPPIPEAIQRALAWNAAHPEEEVETPARRV